MAFPRTFVMGLVMSAGWPQKRGTFRKKRVVNGVLASGAVDQLAQSSAMLGAEDPVTARRLFASCFPADKDWTEPSVDEVFAMLQFEIVDASAAADPTEALVDRDFRRLLLVREELPWEGDHSFYTAPIFEEMITFACLRYLYWGLKEPDAVRHWMAQEDAVRPASLERARASGLALDEGFTGEASEVVASLKQIISG
jgi:hypothetical protein